MRDSTILQQVAVWMAVVGFCVPQAAFSATTQPGPAAVMADVRLQESGVLRGQVVTLENAPVPDVPVSLSAGGKKLAVSKTDKGGFFTFTGLNNGVYQMISPQGQSTYRVWTHQTAPPSAKAGALVIEGTDTVRGQHQMHGFRNLLANPWFVAAVIVAAVAIPVAIHNSKGDGSP